MKRIIAAIVFAVLTLPAHAQWKYKTEKDPMTDSASVTANLPSLNKFSLGFPYQGGTTGLLIIKKNPSTNNNSPDAFYFTAAISINKGQLIEAQGVTVRFNDELPIYFDANAPSGNSSNYLFLSFPGRLDQCVVSDTPAVKGESSSEWTRRYNENKAACEISEKQFIEKLANDNKIRVQATIYDFGSAVFEFKSKGLKLPQSKKEDR